MNDLKKYRRIIVTLALVIVAIIAVYFLYYQSVHRPWRTDGQVLTEIIEITSQVSGKVVKVAVKDNQKVQKEICFFRLRLRTIS